MAELRDASSDVVYRPLSATAVVGFGVSCLYAGVVALSALLAVLQGAPFFFPTPLLLLAVAGFAVSWWGLNDVRSSEGTKAGAKLAVVGMWLSLITGAGYFAYSFFTGVALEQQALNFFVNDASDDSGFFPRIKKGGADKTELLRAFLLTLPASERRVRPDDEAKIADLWDKPAADGTPGSLSRFRSNPVVQALLKGGADAKFEALGVKEWTYEKGSYRVTCLFRVQGPEGVSEFSLRAESTEGEAEGQTRQWFANMMGMAISRSDRSPLGEGLFRLRRTAAMAAAPLENELRGERKSSAKPATDVTDWNRLALPDRDVVQKRLHAIFSGAASDKDWHVNPPSLDLGQTDWERDPQGRVSLTLPVIVILNDSKTGVMKAVEVQTTWRTKEPVDPEQFGVLDRPSLPHWELLSYKYERTKQGKK